jgi:hypothetical protein
MNTRKPERKRPFGGIKCRWEDNIKIDFRETGYENVDWIQLFQDTAQWRDFVNTEMNVRIP